jgi:hypothetical protein
MKSKCHHLSLFEHVKLLGCMKTDRSYTQSTWTNSGTTSVVASTGGSGVGTGVAGGNGAAQCSEYSSYVIIASRQF